MKATLLTTVSLLITLFSIAQFPNPITLSTGQGAPGTQDPIWQCSPWSTTVPGNPMGETYGPTLINNNCAPGSWVDPSSLTPPMNNGNWITGTESNCATNTAAGYRYFRLTLNLPPDCNGFSVTDPGNYILSFDGYVDNFIHDVFINGISQGISGGGFSPGSQLNIYLDGPWVVGTNYVDILVFNSPSSPPGAQNPYGLLLVANATNSANMDTDNDGVNDLDDLCPCDAGVAPHGCPLPSANTCNADLIRSTFLGAGCIELPLCYSDCSMYFLNPSPNSGSSAQAFAQIYGANLISIQDAAENQCIIDELNRINESGVIWIGFNDEAVEGTFVWYDQSPVTYTNWAPNEPNNSGGNENCTQIYPDGMWNDLNCNTADAKSIIEVNLCPVISAPDVIVCTNEPTVVVADNPILGSHPYTFSWDNGASTQSQTVPTIDASYIVTVTDRYNCSGSDTAVVTTKPVPVASVSPVDTLICSGANSDFEITADIAGTAFTWTALPSGVNGSSNGNGNNISQTLTVSGNNNGTVDYAIVPTFDGCTGNTINATVTVSALPNINIGEDFSICPGTSVTLSSTGGATYNWDNGLGSGSSHSVSPSVPTTYNVTGADTNQCSNTASINVGIYSDISIQATGSTTICPGDSVQLTVAGQGNAYLWNADASLSDINIPNPIATPSVTTTYTVSNKVRIGQNLVINGDFEAGDSDFTTGYVQYSTGPFNDGKYIVTNISPNTIHSGFSNCTDHTSSSGNLLLANGACGVELPPNTDLWCQTVPVNPNTDYEFSAWMANVVDNLPSASLLFSINGIPIGNPTPTSTIACDWNEFFVTWNSGQATSATICIAEGTGTCNGNDFAIDDIALYELCELVDSITITVLPTPSVIPHSEIICNNQTVTISLTSTPPGASFDWTATPNNVTGASNGSGTTISQTLSTTNNGDGTVIYTVTPTLNGCEGQTEVITVTVIGAVFLTDNIQICSYDLPYSWNGQTVTSGGNGVATHTTQDGNGCNVITTLNLTVTNPPALNFTLQTENCLPAEVLITPSSIIPNGSCAWYVNGQLINGDCSGASFIENNAGCRDIEFIATDVNGCTSTLVQTNAYCIEALPTALFQLSQPSSITTWTINQSTNAMHYQWVLPNGNTTSEFTPIIHFDPNSGSTVTLYAYSASGCVDSMTLPIEWPFVIPNVITANGDGVNDYFIIAGLIPNSKLIILNRWGNVVYTSNNYDNTWDGRDMNGNYVLEGVYTYTLETPDGTKQHGFIHVER